MKTAFGALTPKIVLGVAAHADDLDFCAAGSIAQFLRAGSDVHYLIVTDGCKGTSDDSASNEEIVATRKQEQRDALAAIGGNPDNIIFLNYCDSELELTNDLKRDIVRAIRTLKPDVVITMDPSMLYSAERGIINHSDHRVVGQATLDAVFPLSRDCKSFPELKDEGLETHKTATVLLRNYDNANFYVDIEPTLDAKMTAIAAHPSQMGELSKVQGVIESMAKEDGAAAGCNCAEGFVRIDLA